MHDLNQLKMGVRVPPRAPINYMRGSSNGTTLSDNARETMQVVKSGNGPRGGGSI